MILANLNLSTLVRLEEAARAAPNFASLRQIIVEITRELVNYQYAALFGIEAANRPRLVALSKGPVFDGPGRLSYTLTAHFLRSSMPITGTSTLIDGSSVAETLTSIIALPLDRRDGRPMAILWLCRFASWTQDERQMLDRLAGAYAHALAALPADARSFLDRILGR